MTHPGHAAVPQPVAVGGLFETHLTVSDLSRSVAFYREGHSGVLRKRN